MKRKLILMAVVILTAVTTFAGGKTHVIAHRGYWVAEGSAQNSRHSLAGALALGIYGSEIDIWMTTDGKLFVNHDKTFKGVTLMNSTSKQCKTLKLDNGESMPQLKDMLKILKKSKNASRLIIEIKPHENKELDQRVARETMRLVRKRHLESKVDYISFSLEVCKELARLDPKANVAYLNGEKTPAELNAMGINGIDYHLGVIRSHPEWVNEAHALGMEVNVWTVDGDKDMEFYRDLGVDYITTNQPVKCIEICNK